MRKIRASKCTVGFPTTAEQKKFLNENHIQGYTPCNLCIGLYFDGKLVYLQSYGKTRRSNIDYVDWDMKRMCGPKDAYVYGGASKLLKYFLENYDLGKGLVTYCDPESFDGHTYEKIGFTLHHICADDYRYVKDGVEYNKQHGKKSNIWARLKKENPDIEPFDVWKTKHTEREMMEKLGYERVMHKGLIAYVISGEPKGKMVYGYIYLILNKINGKTYVGKHKLYNKKWDEDGYPGSGKLLKPAQKKYGIENFEKFLICYTESEEDACKKEEFWIAHYRALGKAEYNIADGGDGGNIAPWTEERKEKISEASKKFIQENPEHINKMVEARKNTDYIAWNKGKKDIFSQEQLEKISEGSKNRVNKQKQVLEEAGLIAVTDKAKELGISRAMILKRFNCFDYYIGQQKYKVCRIDEEPHFEDGRGKSMTEKRREACLKNLGIMK